MDNQPIYKNVILSRIILFASILLLFFWLLSQAFDVYYYKVVGAIFEILWLPMLAGLFVLPIFSIIFWIKGKFSIKSLYLYSFLISALALLLTIVGKTTS